jgi:6-phosphogluconolactonase (cycloisomerase 2 family)
MKGLKLITCLFLVFLTRCSFSAPDISGYIAVLLSLIPKGREGAVEYRITPTVVGLSGTGLVLQNNGGDDLSVSANGSISFATKLKANTSYSVTVLKQPSTPTQVCSVSGGTGTVLNGDITSITINCTTSYTLGGSITGLTGSGFLIQETIGGQTLNITANGSFAFNTIYSLGANYNIIIQTQPSGNSCTITSNSGVISATVTNITITCNTINTLYTLNIQTQQIQAFTANADGTLTFLNSYATGISAGIFLWNGKHIIIGGGTALKSFLRNPDGSLTFANSFTSASSVSGTYWGTPYVHPNGGAFYVKSGSSDDIAKFQIDTNGAFSGEQAVTLSPWTVLGAIHPTANYIWNFHKSGQSQSVIVVNPSDGFMNPHVTNATNIGAPSFYPDGGNCVFSLNGNYLYCADNCNATGDCGMQIKQMSASATSLSPLAPFTVTSEQVINNNYGPKAIILHTSGNYIFVYGVTNIFSFSVNTSTGIIGPGSISTIASPNSCAANIHLVNLAIHSSGTFLYSICSATGDIGAYPISGSGVLSAPVITTSSGSNSGQRLIYVNGI